jgi:hypothetical protein
VISPITHGAMRRQVMLWPYGPRSLGCRGAELAAADTKRAAHRRRSAGL